MFDSLEVIESWYLLSVLCLSKKLFYTRSSQLMVDC